MEAEAILERLKTLGVSVTVNEDRLRLEPASKVPPSLLDEVKANKPELLGLFAPGKAVTPQLPEGHHLKYDGDKASNGELREIHDTVYREGYILLWSRVVSDLIAFVKTDADRAKVPKAFTAYSVAELETLFFGQVSESRLRLIQEAKKHGGRVVGREVTHNE